MTVEMATSRAIVGIAWLMVGDRDCSKSSKITAMILDVRTLADSKLGVDLFRGSASLELYRGSFLQVAAQRLQKIFIYCL